MSSILARCTALGIVAGGFALTGDLGWIADRGLAVLHASDVPAPRTEADAAVPATDPAPAPSIARAVADGPPKPSTAAPAAPPAAPAPADDATDAAVAGAADLRPPTGGPERVDLDGLRAGNRVVLWLATAPRSGRPTAYRCLVFDMVDPARAEALVYEAIAFTPDGQPKATATAPKRVRLAHTTIARGGMIHVRRLGIAHEAAGDPGEALGPVAALDIIR
jgi:hypothetical protein